MKPIRVAVRGRGWRTGSAAAAALLAIGGYFFPILGFGIFALMAVALAMNFKRRRSFCAGVCPNGNLLALSLAKASRKKRIPSFLVEPGFRRMLCGAMMFCMIGLIVRGYPNYASIGKVIWTIYFIALSAGILIGLLYKPRAWCAACPLGTLQDTIGSVTSKNPRIGRRS